MFSAKHREDHGLDASPRFLEILLILYFMILRQYHSGCKKWYLSSSPSSLQASGPRQNMTF